MNMFIVIGESIGLSLPGSFENHKALKPPAAFGDVCASGHSIFAVFFMRPTSSDWGVLKKSGIPKSPWVSILKCSNYNFLVGGFNPSEKYESQLG